MSTERYPSDLTDKEWEVLEPLFPKPKNPGRPRKYPHPQWDLLCAEERMFLEDDAEGSSALEDGLPLLQGVEGGWDLGEDKPGAFGEDEERRISLGGDHRLPERKDESKRQIVVDTLGFVMDVKVHRADIQDRKAAKEVLISLREKFPTAEVVYGDQGYSGEVVEWARGEGMRLEVVYPWWRQMKRCFP